MEYKYYLIFWLLGAFITTIYFLLQDKDCRQVFLYKSMGRFYTRIVAIPAIFMFIILWPVILGVSVGEVIEKYQEDFMEDND